MSSTRRTAHATPPRIARHALALGIALTTAPALAQQAKDQGGDAVELDKVVVTAQRNHDYTATDTNTATKLDLSPRQTPQSLTIVTRQRLDDQDLTSMRKVLDNTNGVYSNAYDTERVLFYARGFPIDTLLVDGVPALPNFNTESVDDSGDTSLYERIEIVRGATGLMNGPGSPAAAVNLVRKHATSHTPELSVEASAGSWSDWRLDADASTPLNADGTLRARGVAVYEDTRLYQDFYHKKTAVLSGIVDWDASARTKVSFGFDHQSNRPTANTWGSFPLFLSDGSKANWPRSVSTAADWSYWDRKTDSVFAQLQHAFDNDWSLHAVANWRRYREDTELLYMYGFPDVVDGTGLEAYAYKNDQRVVERALDAYASGPLTLFGRRHQFALGMNLSRAAIDGSEYEPGEMADPGNFYEWDSHYPRPTFGPAVPLADIDSRQSGLYAVARWSLADPLTLITGARAARYHVDSFYLYDVPPEGPADFRIKTDYRKTIPYAGLVYDATPSVSLYASFTGIFKPQNARGPDGRYLDPVEGRSAEVGVKGEHFDGALTSSLALFDTRQDNIASPAFYPGTDTPILFPDGSQASVASDGVRSRGFELELAGKLSERWQGSLGWSRTLVQDQQGNAFRTFIPNTLVRAFTTYSPAAIEQLTIGGGVNWQSSSKTFVSTPDQAGTIFHQPSVLLVNLMARYQFTPKVSLQLNANNLLDRTYFVLDEYDNTYYGPPSNASLSLRVEL